ncbi:MFS transporter [Plantactinospora sp. S1510]|uniref:MFS transporter n=2 Tax=Plantactinospora alkalitolerans TaxID=2789879 RepID=A0ABS0GS06_9ACTN|nr:MFS transporter [Plantactinospora alkalitolerans]
MCGGQGPLSRRHLAVLPAALLAIGLVTAVISSLGAQLVPTVARAYGVSVSTAQWSLTVALLAGSVATPAMGRLGDGPRRRQVILGCLGLSLTGGVLTAASASLVPLLAGRTLQGVGLGMVPLVIAVAREHLPAGRASSTIAALSVVTVSGVGVGYPITGLIADNLGLRAAFWFGAGISAAVLALAWLVIPARSAAPRRRFDLLGAAALSAALAALLIGLSQGEQWGWSSPPVVGLLAGSGILFALWVIRELRCPYPIVDLRLMRDRTVLTADLTVLFTGVGIYLLMSLVIRFVQTPPAAGYGFGASVVVAGLVLTPFSAGSVLGNRITPPLHGRVGAVGAITIGTVLFSAAMALLALRRDQLWQPFASMGLAGISVGITFAAVLGLIVDAVPAAETGSATSFNQVLRSIGYSIGSALSAVILDAHTGRGQSLPTDEGYTVAFTVGVGVCVLAALLSLIPVVGRRKPEAIRSRHGPVAAAGKRRNENVPGRREHEDVPGRREHEAAAGQRRRSAEPDGDA